jgi:hypothetical protein
MRAFCFLRKEKMMDYQRLWEDLRGRIRAQQAQEEVEPCHAFGSVVHPAEPLDAEEYLEIMDELEGERRGEEYRLIGGVYQREVS